MVDRNLNDRIDFGKAVSFFAERKVCLQPQRLLIHLPNAKDVLDAGLRHFLGNSYRWLPEYDKVVDWLSDNEGQGYGQLWQGKDHHLLADTSLYPATLSSQNMFHLSGT